MSKVYCISDIHGCINEFESVLSHIDLENNENILMLLGDYIHGKDSIAVLDKIIELEHTYGTKKVISLLGNHEEAVIEGLQGITEGDIVKRTLSKEDEKKYINWMRKLKPCHAIDKQIFCHAGVDEKAEDLWQHGTSLYIFTGKYPPTFGRFYMDIIAGHTGTAKISGNPDFHRVFFDGKSHFYIDGSTLTSGILPVLIYDTDTGKYTELVKEQGSYKEMDIMQ